MAYQSGEAEFCAHIIMHMLHMCIAIIMMMPFGFLLSAHEFFLIAVISMLMRFNTA